MIRKLLSSATLSACVVIGAISILAGYVQTGVQRDIAVSGQDIDWQDAELPTDYSGSKERIAFELAALELFGPARSAFDVENPDQETPQTLRLIAIARLDGSLFALVEETGLGILRLKAGDSTQSGWNIESIGKNEVSVVRGAEQKTLPLFPVATRVKDGGDKPKRGKRER